MGRGGFYQLTYNIAKMEKPIITGLLISAGHSGRMGAFKPLLPYNQNPYVLVITQKLLSVCDRVVVVTGFNHKEVEATIKFAFYDGNFFPRVDLVYNPDYEKGMFTSLQAGLKTIGNSDWVLYHFVDQPFHDKKFYKELISKVNSDCDWIQPVYKEKEGHPVLFRSSITALVNSSPQNSILRTIRDLPSVKKYYWNCNYPNILKDYDTPEDVANDRQLIT